MKAIQLRPYQIKAMNAIQGALKNGQKHIVVVTTEQRIFCNALSTCPSSLRE